MEECVLGAMSTEYVCHWQPALWRGRRRCSLSVCRPSSVGRYVDVVGLDHDYARLSPARSSDARLWKISAVLTPGVSPVRAAVDRRRGPCTLIEYSMMGSRRLDRRAAKAKRAAIRTSVTSALADDDELGICS